MADTTVCIEPTAEELAETAILAAEKARMLEIEPEVAMLSFSNFGSVNHPATQKGEKSGGNRQGEGPGADRRRRNAG